MGQSACEEWAGKQRCGTIGTMEHTESGVEQTPQRTGIVRPVFRLWSFIEFLFDTAYDATEVNLRVMWKEIDLFLGVALFLVGLFGFSSGRFCDGNVGDYFTCTRPTSYHYYDGIHITLIVLGAFFVLLWLEKRRR